MEPRTRLSYIRTDLLERAPFLLQEIVDKNQNHTRIHQRQIDIAQVLKVLHSLQEAKSFRELYDDSKIRMKRSFILYLNFCERFGLIIKYKQRKGLPSQYTISHKGKLFYSMFVLE